MAFEVGHKKIGGRQAGSLNKRTVDLVEQLSELGLEPLKELKELIPLLPVEGQVNAYLQLLPYIFPKRKTIDVKVAQESTNQELSQERKERIERIKNMWLETSSRREN